ncbi:hypothetical protein RIF29_24231 [Crotalaria pallida]|uniref:Uncharacterized protein n=1 Tax=Crotalaria pallida TaxID=3830 RepID=A0AAN9EK76_CROPI
MALLTSTPHSLTPIASKVQHDWVIKEKKNYSDRNKCKYGIIVIGDEDEVVGEEGAGDEDENKEVVGEGKLGDEDENEELVDEGGSLGLTSLG